MHWLTVLITTPLWQSAPDETQVITSQVWLTTHVRHHFMVEEDLGKNEVEWTEVAQSETLIFWKSMNFQKSMLSCILIDSRRSRGNFWQLWVLKVENLSFILIIIFLHLTTLTAGALNYKTSQSKKGQIWNVSTKQTASKYWTQK